MKRAYGTTVATVAFGVIVGSGAAMLPAAEAAPAVVERALPMAFNPKACVDKSQVDVPGATGQYKVANGDVVKWVKMYTWEDKYSYNPYGPVHDGNGCIVQVKVYDYTQYTEYRGGSIVKSWTKR